ncbi:hypothetical protein [Pseudomonas fulva]|uniref:hypothetical protein n=1 Tax=Pseudomonas fulva TaxID=47880 RepID=UPI003D089B8E
MLTENRSSNTETKIQHPEGRRERFLKWVLATKHPVPGYLDGTWLARGDDREGYADKYVQGLWVAFKEFAQPAPQPHPDPIAWMVGTAFWWTKEEADRDAAATGKTVTPFGPMFDNGEVERLSAACAANIQARDEAIAEGRRYMGQARALDAVLREARRCVAESADPETGGPTQREAQVILEKIDAALSASAEPKPFRTPDCPECACVQDGDCLCIPSKPSAEPEVKS